jgi:hypothetical protein
MLIAKVENGQVVSIADYKLMFPDTSFPESGPSEDFLAEQGCFNVSSWKQHNENTEKLLPTSPYFEGDKVFTVKVEQFTESELLQITDSKANKVRQQRNILLSDCDWTQVADAPVDKAVWATYRQDLRDISKQPGFPWSVTWPVAP